MKATCCESATQTNEDRWGSKPLPEWMTTDLRSRVDGCQLVNGPYRHPNHDNRISMGHAAASVIAMTRWIQQRMDG